jgi:E3 ubiquitin-protein ligase RNF217
MKNIYLIFSGDHYSELSVLGCKYRFYPDHPLKRRLIRGSILGGKILAAPIVLCLAVVAGAVCAGIGIPAYCCFMLAREIKVKKKFFVLLKIHFHRQDEENIDMEN